MTKLAEKQETFQIHNEAQAPAREAPEGAVPAIIERDEPTTLLAVISRAASDPNCDVDKMRALLEMRRELERDTAKAAFVSALAEMQEDLPVIQRRGQIKVREQVQSKYALWEDIHEQIKPILAKHGFSLNFRVGKSENAVSVTAILSHRQGHSEESGEFVLPADNSGNKNSVQALGSSIKYGQRYTATALLNISTIGEDDDGIAAGAGEKVSAEQRDELIALADDVGADKAKFCKYLGVPSLADIPASQFQRAMEALEAKRKKAS